MAQYQKVIFDCQEVVDACNAALSTDKGLESVFAISTTARAGPNGVKYLDLSATIPGKSGRFVLRMKKERSVGEIAPATDDEVARLNATRNDKFGPLKKRDRHPSIGVQKYKVRIETDDAGRPVGDLPGDDQCSLYFRVLEYLDQFFYATMKARIADGTVVEIDARAEFAPGVIQVSSTKVVPAYQSHVSAQSRTNAGAKLANPITRANMKFDKDTGAPMRVKFFDFSKRFRGAAGNVDFEPLTFDGEPVTAYNVHNIRPGSTISGVVNLNAVCCSNLGISIPAAFEIVVVDAPVSFAVSVGDAFEAGAFDDEDMPASAAGAPAAAAPAAAGADTATLTVGDLDEVAEVLDMGQ